ncbi:WD repeat and HMG-box DNA binding-domain containing protein 1 [Lobulomyces angularis]|nr:WD repeat and HMG-box DNA binding-domain containing protein 1 [Lobulomyces angularis]
MSTIYEIITHSTLLTTGSDCVIHILKTVNIDENRDGDKTEKKFDFQYHRFLSTSITTKGSLIATTSSENEACIFKFDGFEIIHEKTLLRAQHPLKHIDFDSKGKYAAIATDEGTIKIVNVEDITEIAELLGHRAAVNTVFFSPKDSNLASTDIEGNLRIWETASRTCVKKFEYLSANTKLSKLLIKASSPNLCRISWNPTGKFLAASVINKEILIIEDENWSEYARVGPHSEEVSLLRWSPNGVYLAASCMDGSLSIWQPTISTNVPLYQMKHSSIITDMAWHPKENKFYFADSQGYLSYSLNFIPKYGHDKTVINQCSYTNKRELEISRNKYEGNLNIVIGEKEENPLKSKEEEAVKINQHIQFLPGSISLSDEEVDDDNFIEENDCDFLYTELKYRPASKQRVSQFHTIKPRSSEILNCEPKGTENQSSFQPGKSTINSGRYYLAFNLIGVAYSVEQVTHSTIHVEFHDKCIKSFRIIDNYKYTLSALGNSGLILASHSNAANPPTLFFRPVNQHSMLNEWLYHFDKESGEEPEVVALTSKLIAISTSLNYVRFFSLGGLQSGMMSLTSNVVSMVGNDHHLLIVYHLSAAYQDNQNLGFILLNNSRCCIIKDELPISSGSQLDWIGFSEEGIPLSYDSNGILRGLIREVGFSYWTPLLDTSLRRMEKEEYYWPVGVFGENFMTVICKHKNDPLLFPPPILMEIPILLPFLNMPLSGTLEEKYHRGLLLLSQMEFLHNETINTPNNRIIESTFNSKVSKMEKNLDKIGLFLEMVATCKAGKSQRAIDICHTLHSEASIDSAIKLALHHRLNSVADKMSLIKKYVSKTKFLDQRCLNKAYENENKTLSNSMKIYSERNTTTNFKCNNSIPSPEIGILKED